MPVEAQSRGVLHLRAKPLAAPPADVRIEAVGDQDRLLEEDLQVRARNSVGLVCSLTQKKGPRAHWHSHTCMLDGVLRMRPMCRA